MKNLIELSDFREVKNLFYTERLTKEEIKEGLEPMDFHLKIAITHHAYERMYNTENRYCEYEEVEELLIENCEKIINAERNISYIAMNKDSTFGLIIIIDQISGYDTIIIKTVLKNIEKDKNGNEYCKRLKVNMNTVRILD